MPRKARIEGADVAHHVTARAPSGRKLFDDAEDYGRYVNLLRREVGERRWRLFTYCLMPNHVHLLLRTPECNLGQGVRRLHGEFARSVNDRREAHGHVFGGRFHNRLVASERHFVACLRYIARNPLQAGLCNRAEAWPWGAHRALAGLDAVPDFIDAREALGPFGGATPREAYLQLVARSDADIVWELRRRLGADQWLVAAVDLHGIHLEMIARELGVGRSTLQRRLATARSTEG